MNTQTNISTGRLRVHPGERSSGRLWTGRVLTGLVVLFLAVDGLIKVLFSIGFGVLVWVSLALRESRLTLLILRRQFSPSSDRGANLS